MATKIRNLTSYEKGGYREIFDVEENGSRLKIYIKSGLNVYDVPLFKEVRLEREEFCASKLIFYVLKDSRMSFNQGDAVSVKLEGDGIFFGYVFTKSRDKENLIRVVCYDQMRYMKNRRTYTRGRMTLEEVVRRICNDNSLRMGDCDKTRGLLGAVAADNVSLLDVVKKACGDERRLTGERFILYDDYGKLYLKNEENLAVDVLIDTSQAENYVYTDTIDKDCYNTIELYSDVKRANVRYLTTVGDDENTNRWGTLILSKKVTGEQSASDEAKLLLDEYNRVNREIVLKRVKGDTRFIPGSSVYLKMSMGDLYFDNYVRVKKAVHIFKDNMYFTDLYLDGSEVE